MKKNLDENLEQITSSSSKEDISSFFSNKFKVSQEVQTNLIKEDISGDILLDLQDNDLKKLGLKIGPIKKVRKYLNENKDNFPEIKIEEKINESSSVEEVKTFFENCINFKLESELDGMLLLELSDEDISKLGLNIGQKKRLIKYINFFKSNKPENKEDIDKKEEKSDEKEEEKAEQKNKDKEEEEEDKKKEDKDKKEEKEVEENEEKKRKIKLLIKMMPQILQN